MTRSREVVPIARRRFEKRRDTVLPHLRHHLNEAHSLCTALLDEDYVEGDLTLRTIRQSVAASLHELEPPS